MNARWLHRHIVLCFFSVLVQSSATGDKSLTVGPHGELAEIVRHNPAKTSSKIKTNFASPVMMRHQVPHDLTDSAQAKALGSRRKHEPGFGQQAMHKASSAIHANGVHKNALMEQAGFEAPTTTTTTTSTTTKGKCKNFHTAKCKEGDEIEEGKTCTLQCKSEEEPYPKSTKCECKDGFCDFDTKELFTCKDTSCVVDFGTMLVCEEGKKIKDKGKCTLKCAGKHKGWKADPKEATCKCKEGAFGVCNLNIDSGTCTDESGCFPRSSSVLQPDGSEVSVAALRPGDAVVGLGRTWGKLVEDIYLADFHAGRPEQDAVHQFLEVQHACHNGRPLRVTSGHLVYAVDLNQPGTAPRLVPAGSLQPSVDALLAVGCRGVQTRTGLGSLQFSMVQNVTTVWEHGLFNPFTSSLTSIVDGVATSNMVLYSPTAEKAWESLASARKSAETIGWLVSLLPRLGLKLGMPTSWVSDKGVHGVLIRILDVVFDSLLDFGALRRTP